MFRLIVSTIADKGDSWNDIAIRIWYKVAEPYRIISGEQVLVERNRHSLY